MSVWTCTASFWLVSLLASSNGINYYCTDSWAWIEIVVYNEDETTCPVLGSMSTPGDFNGLTVYSLCY